MSKHDHFQNGKYDMEEYWSKRAEFFDEDEFKAVCVLKAPKERNEYFDALQRSLFSKLLDKIGNLENKKVLEIGCGIGRWAKYMIEKEPTIHYAGIDISPKMVEIAKKRAPLANILNMSGDNLNFENESFDIVFCVTVLQHMPYEKQYKAIKEMCRITKGRGHIIIIEDTKKPKESFNLFANPSYKWKKLFEDSGCEAAYILKHKCDLTSSLFNYSLLILNKIGLTNIKEDYYKIFVILETVFCRFLPEKYFSGVGIVLRKKI